MFNGAMVTLAGYVAREPIYTTVGENIPKVIVRVAWSSRYNDRVTGEWRDGKTSFANVNCWRKLAGNTMMSLRKGQPIVVTGRLQVREHEDKDGNRRTFVDIEADAIGHDLSRGATMFQRFRPQPEDAEAQDQRGELAGNAPALALTGQVPSGASSAEGQPEADVFNTDAVAELVEAELEKAGSGSAAPF
jgi:single-strand DNA-binding protein